MNRSLLRHARPAYPTLALAVALGLLAAGATVGQAVLLGDVIGRVFQRHAGLGQLALPLTLLPALILLRAGLLWGREVLAAESATRVKSELRKRLARHLLRLGPMYTRGERTGELVTTATEGIERLDPYFSGYLPHLVLAVCTPLLIVLAVLPVDWISALILLGTSPFIPLLMFLIGGYSESRTRRQWEALGRLGAAFLDTVQGLSTVLLFGGEGMKRAQLEARSERFRETTISALRTAALSGTVLELMSALAIGVMAVALAVRLIDGGITFAHAILVFFLTPEFYRPLRELGGHYHAGTEGVAAGQRIAEVLETVPTVSTSSGGLPEPAGPIDVTLSNVTYTYPGADTPALTDLNLMLPAGSCTALVGRSGAGKSTLVSLLMRWIDPAEGVVTANDVPLTLLRPDEWRRQVALVSQRPHLFQGSVLDNVRLSRPAASLQEVRQAMDLAGVGAFVDDLPAGVHTAVGERGARLSAGQIQRIAVARAILKDAPLLILDEPTSSLDPETEVHLRDALRSILQGHTVLIVAHRLNTVAAADALVVLEAGRIVEMGKPSQVLAGKGPYARIAGSEPSQAVLVNARGNEAAG